MNWEEAVQQLRSKPENKQVILDNYFDKDLDAAVERFRVSEEFESLMAYIPSDAKKILDIGAGRGMASYGFAKHGLKVTALEPDPSNDVGAGAIRIIASKHNLPIDIVETFGESLPFDDQTFDVVYVRQVLHHANDLAVFCREVKRVLKPGGVFIATREHVLSSDADLQAFLDGHPLHHLYGGEHAFTLDFYLKCLTDAGLKIKHVLHPYSSVINYAPMSTGDMKANFAGKLALVMGKSLASSVIGLPAVYKMLSGVKARQDNSPGRLYSFVCIRP